MRYEIIAVIVMALVSYLPRFIPMVFMKKPIKSNFIKSTLYYMPYAILASLTFPAIFFSTGNVLIASIGTGVAIVLSYFKVNMAIVAVVGVLVVFGLGFVI